MHGIAMAKTHFIELLEEMKNHFCSKAETMKTTCCQTGLDKGKKMPHRLKTALSCKIGKVGAAAFALTAVFSVCLVGPASIAMALDGDEPSLASEQSYSAYKKPEAPMVMALPLKDGSVAVFWTESPLTSQNPDIDQRSYTYHQYSGDTASGLKTMVELWGKADEVQLIPADTIWPGYRYTVLVEAVNEMCPDDDPNKTASSEYFTFVAPRASSYEIGDVNGNGVVNVVDAQIAYELATTDHYKDRADYDEMMSRAEVILNGQVDAVDAFVIQYAAFHGWL